MGRVCLLFAVLLTSYVSGNLIRSADSGDIGTKDVQVDKELDNNAIEVPVVVVPEVTANMKCAEIGEFVSLRFANLLKFEEVIIETWKGYDDNCIGSERALACAANKLFLLLNHIRNSLLAEECMNHKDCCTNACLGYMKRCVT